MSVSQMTASIIVGGGAADAYRLWSDVEGLADVMPHVRAVTRTGDARTHWVIEGPFGRNVEWDAEITRMDADKRIAWRSAEAGPVRTSGQVTFNPLPDAQTEITVVLQYATSALRDAAARDWTRRALEEDLRSFKAHVEKASRGDAGAGGAPS